jgi:hypothetical protein
MPRQGFLRGKEIAFPMIQINEIGRTVLKRECTNCIILKAGT